MPNNLRVDYVGFHAHSPLDVQGLGVALFPPTQTGLGVTVDPTSNVIIPAVLPEMTLTITPPTNFPLWEVHLAFSGSFRTDTAGEGANVGIFIDATQIPNTTRVGRTAAPNIAFEIAVSGVTLVPSGVPFTARVLWSSTLIGATATAIQTLRRLDATLRPYGGP